MILKNNIVILEHETEVQIKTSNTEMMSQIFRKVEGDNTKGVKNGRGALLVVLSPSEMWGMAIQDRAFSVAYPKFWNSHHGLLKNKSCQTNFSFF